MMFTLLASSVEGIEGYAHPALASEAVWAGVVVIVIAFMFLAAAVVGPIVRALHGADPAADAPPVDPHHAPHGH